jgi:hypothetical protein
MPVHFLKHIAFAGLLAAISTGAASATAIKTKRNDRILSPPCLPCSYGVASMPAQRLSAKPGVTLVSLTPSRKAII